MTSRLSWMTCLAAIGILTIVLLVLLGVASIQLTSVDQSNDELLASVQSNMKSYADAVTQEIESLRQDNEELRKQLELPTAAPVSLPERPQEVSLKHVSRVWSILALGGIGVLSQGILAIVASFFAIQFTTKRWEKRLEQVQEKAFWDGAVKSLKVLVEDEDVLSQCLQWLRWYQIGKARMDDAAAIQTELLKRLISRNKLRPIGEPGKVVRFDPRAHTAHEAIRAGEDVIVAEPGWRLGSAAIKQPIVRRPYHGEEIRGGD